MAATVGSSSGNLVITSDSEASNLVGSHDFSPLAIGQPNEWTFYVYNNASTGQFITYLPTNYEQNQTSVSVTTTVLEYGVQGQIPLTNLTLDGTGVGSLPYVLPEKDITNPTNGFYLMPSKMVKIDVQVNITQTDGTPINIPFEIAGAYISGSDASPTNVQWQDYSLPLTASQ